MDCHVALWAPRNDGTYVIALFDKFRNRAPTSLRTESEAISQRHCERSEAIH